MKKILLLSDSHSYIDNNIVNHAKWSDEIWHAGDIGNIKVIDSLKKQSLVRAVYGNIDNHLTRKIYPENIFFNCEGTSVLITHIGGYPGKYSKRVQLLLSKHKPKIFISGHSHILKVQYDKKLDLLHLNPGAAGNHGFHKIRTMLRFTLDNGAIKDLEIIELATRG